MIELDMSPVIIKSVETNVKGHSGIKHFTRMNAIVGENGSGKTALLDAIRLAFLGQHPDTLKALIPEGAGKLFSDVKGYLGQAVFSIPASSLNSRGGVATALTDKLGQIEDVASCFPTVAPDLKHSADAIRREVFEHFGKLDKLPKPLAMSSAQEKLWEEYTEDKDENATSDALSAYLSRLSLRLHAGQLAAARNKSRLEKESRELRISNAERASGTEQLPYLEAKLERALVWENNGRQRSLIDRYETELEQLNKEESEIDETRGELRRSRIEEQLLIEERGRLQKEDEDSADTDDLEQRIMRLEALLSLMMTLKDGGLCFACNHEVDTAEVGVLEKKYRERLEARKAELESDYQEMTERHATIAKINQRISALGSIIRMHEAEIEEHENQKGRLSERLASVREAVTNVEDVGESAEELRNKIDELRDAEARKARLEEIEGQLIDARRLYEDTKVLNGEVKTILKELVTSAKDEAEKAINSYMPEGMKAELLLDDKRCEWRVLAQKDGKGYGRSACGMEKSALMIARLLALSEKAPYRIVMLDDEHIGGLSQKSLGALCRTLEKRVECGDIDQVFVATWRKENVPRHWSQVEL